MLNQEESFKRIYDQYQNMVLHTAYQYLQNQEDAEEITQDVFVQVYHSYAKFEGKSSLKTWIYRICINKSLDYIKYKNSKKRGFIFFGFGQIITKIGQYFMLFSTLSVFSLY